MSRVRPYDDTFDEAEYQRWLDEIATATREQQREEDEADSRALLSQSPTDTGRWQREASSHATREDCRYPLAPLLGWPPVTISLLAKTLSVANVVIERDVWAMRHVLGLPVAFDGRSRVAYSPTPDLDSDVFDLADKLIDSIAA